MYAPAAAATTGLNVLEQRLLDGNTYSRCRVPPSGGGGVLHEGISPFGVDFYKLLKI